MKFVLSGAIGVFLAASVAAVDITAVMREANAATVSYVKGSPYNTENPNGTLVFYGSGNLFDNHYEDKGRWIDKSKPTPENPIVIQYTINPLWNPGVQPVAVVVTSFTLHLNCVSSDQYERMPTVFSLEASRDGETWTTLYAVDPDKPVNDWAVDSVKFHTFEIPSDKRGNYRMYRFCVTQNNGAKYTGAQELVLEGDLTPVAIDPSAKTVFSDAAYWFRGANDINGDGVLQSGEMVNALRLDDPAHSTHACTVVGPATNVRINVETVREPYRNATRTGVGVLHFDQPVWHDEEKGEDVAVMGYVKLSGIMPVTNTGPFTAVMRLKCDGLIDPNENYNRVVNFGYNLSQKVGFSLMFEKLAAKNQLVPRIAFGVENQPRFGTDIEQHLITTNEWIDLAVTLGNGKVSVYWCGEDNFFMAMEHDIPAGLGTEGFLSDILLGGHQATDVPKNKDFGRGVFRGSISRFGIWGRTLSQDEILEAFGSPRPDHWRLGVPNGWTAEFGGAARETTVDTASDCQNMPAEVSAVAPQATINFTVASDWAQRAQLLRILPTPDSGSGMVKVSVGTWTSRNIPFAGGVELIVDIPKRCLAAGERSLSIVHVSGDALAFDSIALGGSVQIGEVDSFYEFKRMTLNGVGAYDVHGGNALEVLNYATPAGEREKLSNVVIRVWTPAAQAQRRHVFKMHVDQRYSDEPVPVSVYLDGRRMKGFTLSRQSSQVCVLDDLQLSPGLHVFELVNEGPCKEAGSSQNSSVLVDWFSLDVKPTPPGLVFILSAIGGVW